MSKLVLISAQLWKVEARGEERDIIYLATLVKHTCSVNVVRWCPTGKCPLLTRLHAANGNLGEMLATAGDDGNILLWEPAENEKLRTFGDDGEEDKEHWRVKRSFRILDHEVYDLAWSPNGQFFITGSMDNVARIWNANTGRICPGKNGS